MLFERFAKIECGNCGQIICKQGNVETSSLLNGDILKCPKCTSLLKKPEAYRLSIKERLIVVTPIFLFVIVFEDTEAWLREALSPWVFFTVSVIILISLLFLFYKWSCIFYPKQKKSKYVRYDVID